jgi:hypothetical protein
VLWAAAQVKLGQALSDLANAISDEGSLVYLTESIQRIRSVLRVRSRDVDPEQWAFAMHQLGESLMRLAERTTDAPVDHMIVESIDAFSAALKVRTRESNPRDWELSQAGLGVARMLRVIRANDADKRRFRSEAAAAFVTLLEVRADPAILNVAVDLYHEFLFDFESARAVLERWSAAGRDESPARRAFARSWLTTRDWTLALTRVAQVRDDPEPLLAERLAFGAYAVIAAIALQRPVGPSLETLIALADAEAASPSPAVTERPISLGVRYFVAREPILAVPRPWIERLLNAVGETPPGELSAELRKLLAEDVPR